jgi:alanyl aminopeptidase
VAGKGKPRGIRGIPLLIPLATTFLAGLLLAQAAVAQDLAPPALRLPDAVRPLGYAAELTIRPAESAFRGSIDIEIEVKRATPVVWLNARFLAVESARAGANSAQLLPGGEDFVGLRFDPPLAPGAASLHLEYRGELSERDTAGAFRQQEAGDWYVYTQLEPIYARRVFPCFDEPGYKVPWQLSLVVPAANTAVSNTPAVSETALPENMKRVRFAPTRPLPSYLIAFAVGPFDSVDAGTAGRNATPLRIIVPKGMAAAARYAAQVTPRLLEMSEAYTGIPYPYGKLDSLAILQRGQFGAMENPGLITYALPLILARPQDETPRFRQSYAYTAAHEIAHMWFGDLVTHAWWDDIWLNESFATWMSDKVIERFEPSWNVRAKSVLERNYAMKSDSLVSARRIRQPIEGNDDIFNAFDPITYAKGGAVLGMFERWIGEERFRLALQRYLAKYADGAATAADFLAELDGAQAAAGTAFATFLDQAGLPLVSIDLDCSRAGASLRLAQQRYLPIGSGGSKAQLWKLPVCVDYGTADTGHRACTLMTDAVALLPAGRACPSWIRVDPSRYFRVAYLGRAGKAAGARQAPLVDWVAEIGDLEALARNGAIELGAALERLQPLAAPRNRDVAQSAIWMLADLRTLVPEELRPNWERYVSRLFAQQARRLGFTPRPQDSEDTLRLRPALIDFLATDGGDAALHAQAMQLALRWLGDRAAVDGTMIESVLQAAARRGDREFFERLRAAVLGSGDRRDRRHLYIALGSFDDPAIARSALALILDPSHDYREAFQIAWSQSGTPRGSARAYDFIKSNFDALVARAPRDSAAFYPRLAGNFCSEAGRADVDGFFRERAPKFAGGPRILAQTLERIGLCAAFRQSQQANFSAFLRRH